jgi:hypothetical protein
MRRVRIAAQGAQAKVRWKFHDNAREAGEKQEV